MGPGQGGSRSEWGWEEGNIKGGHWARAREGPRTISPKKGQESFISDSLIFDFYNVGTPFHYVLLYTLYANGRISFLCFCISGFCILDIGKEIPQGGIWAQVRVGPGRSGVGRKEIFREVIGPGAGRVP